MTEQEAGMPAPGEQVRVVTPIPHATGGESECAHAISHLYDYLDSEMTEEDEARMRAHIAHCSPCLAELGVEELVKRLVRRSCHEQAPESLRVRILAQLSVSRTTYVVESGVRPPA
ncbi:mycothiol system anti-sigma-R factor [Cellulomonas sp. PhB143]|uniref:mycothiol system anti-sigma-R factor n=1 Tax=Cellulomonas sp. PhB143 TaxID=2485186 RepID=UPI000FAF71EA|nr:mycothiol system anti-sigma-R factor [Cellulomonas sp. PhB143]ROS78498.1 mycothiol system anti-sigma-R factor [Cellulomonas sp. PhB143]